MSEKKQSEDFPDIGPYLWDGSGEPDQEIQRLESALARYRHAGALPTFPDALSAAPRKFFGFALELNWLSRAAAIAFVLIAVALSGLWIFTRKLALPAAPGWDVVRVDGTPLVGANSITSSANKATLHPGQTLVTNSDSRATISVAGLGEIQVDPDSRLRLLLSSANRKRISLEIGTIHAAIWAPPGQFVVRVHTSCRPRWFRHSSHHARLGRLPSPWPRFLHSCRRDLLHASGHRARHALL